MATGKITVRDMGFETILGALSFEREKPQPIRLHFSLWLDFAPITASDDLNATVDYAALSEALKRYIQESKFILIETLVSKSAEFLLAQSEKIQAAWVKVEKPEALPGSAVSEAEIKITRNEKN